MENKMKIKKLDARATIPTYGTQYSAGADIYALLEEDVIIKPGETFLVKTGISFEIPNGYVGLIYARSGLASKSGIAPANKVGVIDSDYRGELMVPLYNHSDKDFKLEHGLRIAQLVIAPYIQVEFEEVEELDSTERGHGGFGSTGLK